MPKVIEFGKHYEDSLKPYYVKIHFKENFEVVQPVTEERLLSLVNQIVQKHTIEVQVELV